MEEIFKTKIRSLIKTAPYAGKPVNDDRTVSAEKLELDLNNVTFTKQVHSDEIFIVDKSGFAGEGDGLITDKKKLFLSIVTADCVPVFIHNSEFSVIGLIHAGWRGIEKGIVQKAVIMMEQYFDVPPYLLDINFGPSIKKCCYEVKEDLSRHFPQETLHRQNCRIFLNMEEAIKLQITELGVAPGHIYSDNTCTFCDSTNFPSFRRDGKKSGRLFTFATLV